MAVQPGAGGASLAPVQTRDERPWSYVPSAFSAPDRHDPAWQFLDLDRLAPLLDGATDAAGEQNAPSATFRPEDILSALAWQQGDHEPIVIDGEQAEPVVAVVEGTGLEPVVARNVRIEARPHSSGTVVLEYRGSASLRENVEIIVGDGAHLTVVSLQQWADDALHAAAHQAVVGRDASLKHVVVSLGGGVVRINPSVRLAGDGAETQLLGLAFADAGQHFESQVFLHHEGRRTKGNVTYKGALQGAGARTVWIGDVLIGPDAVGTDSYEQNRNLVLTEGARADSIPNLEIKTGDIQGAGHASATGRFDDEQLFYLRARGIPEDEARRLVVIGFLAEIIQQLPGEALRERLFEAVAQELSR
ncbi:MAG: Fe-S cluster assembly protein SufD [Microbacteriaceae bacterium]|nr:Fe-S cluster assembly protein SufD [Microbacteriaceae bacterium]